jgi:uncharacterized protein YndB with AHSA1/START domain
VPSTENQTVLELSHRFDATPERVFDAWTNPDLLKRWWAAGADWEGADAQVDLRLGGRIWLSMRDPGGAVYNGGGVFTEIERPARLGYTWEWEGEGESYESHVLVEFVDAGGGTELRLTHSGLPSEESRDRHEHGWTACLANLESRVIAA